MRTVIAFFIFIPIVLFKPEYVGLLFATIFGVMAIRFVLWCLKVFVIQRSKGTRDEFEDWYKQLPKWMPQDVKDEHYDTLEIDERK